MTDDIRAVEASIISMLEVAIREPLNIILSLGWMLMMSAKLTFFVLAMLVVIGGVIGQIGKTLKRRSTNIQDTIGRMISTIEETISGLRIIQAYQAESYKRNQFQATNQSLYQQSTSLARRYELSSPLTEFLAISVFSLLLWFGGGMVLHHEMEAAAFFGFIAMFSLLIQPAKSFSTAFYSIRIGLASAHRVFEILDAHNTIVVHPNASPMPVFQDSIDFDGVGFNYSSAPDRAILSRINLHIAKGKTIAIVGPSGAGKTTLVDLLPRFYDVREGTVYIDGVDIRLYTLHSLRAMIAVVSQEPILFNDTVYQNITLGKSYTHDEVVAAARIANAHDFVQSLETGYDTMIGDRGGKLSGGERQRLTIARAVLKNAPILILDEATSSLDAASERLVQDALYKLMEGRTTIVIAHRLATIQGADEIIVMNEGQIVQRGTHSSLMEVDGLYARLVELQAFE
jgi:subfamily B ATP-binding cassette protein MsbA